MKKLSIVLIGCMLALSAQEALAQPPTQAPPPTAPGTPPPPASAPKQARPRAGRYGSISGSWLMPTGDFENVAGDGWAITLEGYQFIHPKAAFGSQAGYQSFGEKNGVQVSNFPVDAVLKFYPKPGTGKIDLYLTGGIGFNYHRTEVGNSSVTDYYFGTQAGAGLELHTNGPVSVLVDGVYHWIFSDGIDTDFIALRGGLAIPLTR